MVNSLVYKAGWEERQGRNDNKYKEGKEDRENKKCRECRECK
jgi:hypothetical protein